MVQELALLLFFLHLVLPFPSIVALYCALLRDRFSDASIFGVSLWKDGCNTALPSNANLGKLRCDTSPGYLKDTCSMSHKLGKMHVMLPLRYYLERVMQNISEYLDLGR